LISGFTDVYYGLQHAIITPDFKNPKVTLSAKLATPHNPKNDCSWLRYATAAGSTFVGFGDAVTSTSTGSKYHLAYNVEQGGKGLFSKEQIFTTPTEGCQCLTGVATDGKRFLVIWGQERIKPPTTWDYVWRGRIFDLNGKPLAQAQDLKLQSTPMNLAYKNLLRETFLMYENGEFIVFYNSDNGAVSSTHMARLKIQP
jgi:hypothetical protein